MEEKASRASGIIAISGGGYPSWTSPKYGAMAREGYQKNPVVYRCIRMIAETAAMVPIRCFQGDTELLNHPLMDLLNRPNKDQSLPDLMESFYAYLQVAGNSYVEFVDGGEGRRELYVLRPDRMKIVPDNKGWPSAFEYTVNGRAARFNNAVGSTEVNPIFHMRLFHPQDDHYGQSPLQAASASVDIQNAANGWNKALFDNAARPSGALIYKGPDGAHLTEEQFHRLKTELENNYQGNRNAGRPLLLEGGLEWTPISLTPQDMASKLKVEIFGGHLQSKSSEAVLAGANMMAVETPNGWEILQFKNAKLVASSTYELSGFLRGQFGSEAVMLKSLPSGARVFMIDEGLHILPLTSEHLNAALTLNYGPTGQTSRDYGWKEEKIIPDRVGLKPLAPAHLRANQDGQGGYKLRWTRRSRIGGDDFEAPEISLGETSENYRITLIGESKSLEAWETTSPVFHITSEKIISYASVNSLHVQVSQIGNSGLRGYVSQVKLR